TEFALLALAAGAGDEREERELGRGDVQELSLPAGVEAVQRVRSEWVAGSGARVGEGAGGVGGQAEALHHPARAGVDTGCERDDLVERERPEADIERAPAAFRRVAATPVLACQTPADLDRGRERRVERGRVQADEADERRRARYL